MRKRIVVLTVIIAFILLGLIGIWYKKGLSYATGMAIIISATASVTAIIVKVLLDSNPKSTISERNTLQAEHTKNIISNLIEPISEVFNKLWIAEKDSNLTLAFSKNGEIIYIDPTVLNDKDIPTEIAFIAFIEKILEGSNLKQQINPYLLYDLLTIHSKELAKEFEKFLDAVASNNKTGAEKQLGRIRNVLSYLKTIVLFNEPCPYTNTTLQEKVPKDLTIKVKEVKKSINISRTFLY